ncbi:MAG: DUF59 domain-containing protein [Bacteroidales bacterium]|nr:DUF59 domain-containing protein [Bacteroidales bacterium]
MGNDLDKRILEDEIKSRLRTIYDPELPVNIYDLGLIYEFGVDDDFVASITMTLTVPNCPVAESLPQEVREAIQQIKGIKDVKLEIVFEPPWDMEMMTDEARLELGFL